MIDTANACDFGGFDREVDGCVGRRTVRQCAATSWHRGTQGTLRDWALWRRFLVDVVFLGAAPPSTKREDGPEGEDS